MKTKLPDGIKVREVHSVKDLPALYIGLRDDLDWALGYMVQHEERLAQQGYKIVYPLNIVRLITESNTFDKGKKTVTIKRSKPSTMLTIEIKRIE